MIYKEIKRENYKFCRIAFKHPFLSILPMSKLSVYQLVSCGNVEDHFSQSCLSVCPQGLGNEVELHIKVVIRTQKYITLCLNQCCYYLNCLLSPTNEVAGRLCFHKCLSVQRVDICLSIMSDRHPQGRCLPGRHPLGRHPPSPRQTLLRQRPPGQTPPPPPPNADSQQAGGIHSTAMHTYFSDHSF